LEKTENPLDIIISSLITKKPKTVDSSLLAIHALQIMNINKITNLIVTRNSKYTGMIHIHDLIKIGL
jgi:arabinose-5-phosphate isomerase